MVTTSTLAYAKQHGLTLLTHNRADFERLAESAFERGEEHAGIIIAVAASGT
jgi:hypothetical protein